MRGTRPDLGGLITSLLSNSWQMITVQRSQVCEISTVTVSTYSIHINLQLKLFLSILNNVLILISIKMISKLLYLTLLVRLFHIFFSQNVLELFSLLAGHGVFFIFLFFETSVINLFNRC